MGWRPRPDAPESRPSRRGIRSPPPRRSGQIPEATDLVSRATNEPRSRRGQRDGDREDGKGRDSPPECRRRDSRRRRRGSGESPESRRVGESDREGEVLSASRRSRLRRVERLTVAQTSWLTRKPQCQLTHRRSPRLRRAPREPEAPRSRRPALMISPSPNPAAGTAVRAPPGASLRDRLHIALTGRPATATLYVGQRATHPLGVRRPRRGHGRSDHQGSGRHHEGDGPDQGAAPAPRQEGDDLHDRGPGSAFVNARASIYRGDAASHAGARGAARGAPAPRRVRQRRPPRDTTRSPPAFQGSASSRCALASACRAVSSPGIRRLSGDAPSQLR